MFTESTIAKKSIAGNMSPCVVSKVVTNKSMIAFRIRVTIQCVSDNMQNTNICPDYIFFKTNNEWLRTYTEVKFYNLKGTYADKSIRYDKTKDELELTSYNYKSAGYTSNTNLTLYDLYKRMMDGNDSVTGECMLSKHGSILIVYVY